MQKRQVGIPRRLGAHCTEDEQLLGGVRDVILATDHVGDALVQVVDRDCEVVEHGAVGAGDHRIVHVRVREADLAAHQIVEAGMAVIRHPEPNRATLLRLSAKATLGAVALLVGLHVIRAGVRVVGVAGGQQLAQRLLVTGRIANLGDRSLVPTQAEPGQRVENLIDVGLGRALAIGIFDPQHERAGITLPVLGRTVREQPVVERRPSTADMKRAGR
jgi:hypothetical protein